ncbi:hypothetical protein [Streptomyces niger]|uniref:hypothetical protein n=1 Tax=Streptomyces niger TaxID=66373 RepID=UPI000ABE1B1C|nr:hypothetical protein [Streptomyces niger]
MDDRTDSQTKKTGKEKRLDLSVPQVAGSALAAAVAAYLAGRLGVYGTVIGAGVVSVVATTGGSIFQHLFRRTGEQVKEATVSTRPRPRRRQQLGGRAAASGAYAREASRPGPGSGPGVTMVLPTFGRDGAEDEVTSVAAAMDRAADRDPASAAAGTDDATRAMPVLSEVATRALCPTAPEGAEDETRPVPRRDARTMALRTVAEPSAAASVEPSDGAPEGEPPAGASVAETSGEEISRTVYGTRWRGRRRTWLVGLAVFLLAMAGVTAFELATGHDASGARGTSVTNLFRPGGGGNAPSTPTPSPSTSTGDTEKGGGATESPTPQPDSSDDGSPSPSSSDPAGDSGTENGSDGASTSPSPSPSDGDESSSDPAPTPTDGADGDATDDQDAGSDSGSAQGAGQSQAPGSS